MNRSRREFLEQSMLATAAALAAGPATSSFADDEPKEGSSPNDRLNVCVMGVNGRGGSHVGAFRGAKGRNTQITYVCDVDASVAARIADGIEKDQGSRPEIVPDIRKALEDKNLNIVSIATPNHWHSLGAIWRRERLTCPNRETLGSFLLQVLDDAEMDYLDFHLHTVCCPFCLANLADLQSLQKDGGPQTRERRRRIFQSSAGYFQSAREG